MIFVIIVHQYENNMFYANVREITGKYIGEVVFRNADDPEVDSPNSAVPKALLRVMENRLVNILFWYGHCPSKLVGSVFYVEA